MSFSKRNSDFPLQGCRVLNTRPALQAAKLTKEIEALGGQVIACPALAIKPIDIAIPTIANTPSPVIASTASPVIASVSEAIQQGSLSMATLLDCFANARNDGEDAYDIACFISVSAVHYFFEQVSPQAWPASCQTFAIGEATRLALAEKNIPAVTAPGEHAEALLALPALQDLKHKRILLVQGQRGRTHLLETFKARGASVQVLPVYQRTPALYNPILINEIWRDDRIDIILFTSHEAMEQIFIMFGKDALTWIQKKTCVVISHRLALLATAKGIQTVFVTRPHQIITGLIDAYQQKRMQP